MELLLIIIYELDTDFEQINTVAQQRRIAVPQCKKHNTNNGHKTTTY